MLNYSLDDLRAFCYAARTGQFQDAAELLFISPSALSRRIANLETGIGGPLFVRSTRQLKLTPLGVGLYPKVSPLLAQLDAALSQASKSANGYSGNLAVGTVATVAYNIAPHVMQKFREHHPDQSVSIHDGLATSIASLVAEGKVEFGISTQMAFGPEIEAELITEYGYVLVAARSDVLFSQKNSVSWKALQDIELVGLGPTSSTRMQIDAEMQRLGYDLNWGVEIDQLSTILEMVRVGRQRAVLPSLINGSHDGLTYLPIVKPKLARGLFFIQRKNHSLTPAARTLLTLFRAAIREKLG